jgi:hypothetical protein
MLLKSKWVLVFIYKDHEKNSKCVKRACKLIVPSLQNHKMIKDSLVFQSWNLLDCKRQNQSSVQICSKEPKTMSDTSETVICFTHMYMVPFKCHFNCGNLFLIWKLTWNINWITNGPNLRIFWGQRTIKVG